MAIPLHTQPADADAPPLWRPDDPHATATHRFLAAVNAKHGLELKTYEDLYQWSITHYDRFWRDVWDFTGVVGERGGHVVDMDARPSTDVQWFKDAKLNWAENMLQERSSTKLAVVQATEPTPHFPDVDLKRCTYAELYTLVADLASALLKHGFKPGQRVASYSSNCIENLAACLATTALGGIWVSAAADFGPEGVLERFDQVQPSFIFSVDAVVYNGKVHDHLSKLSALLSGLSGAQPNTIIIHTIPHPEDRSRWPASSSYVAFEDFVREGQQAGLGRTPDGEIEWVRSAFDYPLWILFSSGTTGRPKPIVHRAGGMLLQANKEFAVCADLRPDDVFFYYTTTGWMMWNFLAGGLAHRCTLVLYDGSPLKDPSVLWRLTDQLNITVFGTSAKYLDQLSKGYKPREHHSLKSLRHIYSTGSPLAPLLFDYVYKHIHPNVLLGSITGGTDICSLFFGMNSSLPVFRGELQCRMLGMAVTSFGPDGRPTPPGTSGELVCTTPFPCMPAGFWPLPGFGHDEATEAAREKYHNAYFAEYNGVWYHGDHVLITRSREGNGGGVIMLGRSDGVLNPGGIRFGSSEIYDVLDLAFKKEIVDYVAVGQLVEGGADERVVLFVTLPEGHKLTPEFEGQIKKEMRARRSPRHAPAKTIQVDEIPYTLNGKRVEVLVKKIINGASLSTVNPATLSNPGCLEAFVKIGEELRKEVGM